MLQLPSSEMAELSRMVPALPVTYVLQCSDLCEDFQEDLQFHFSLGLNSLLVYSPSLTPASCPLLSLLPPLQAVASSGSWLSSVRSQLSWLQSVVSLEYVVPAALLVAALLVSALCQVVATIV